MRAAPALFPGRACAPGSGWIGSSCTALSPSCTRPALQASHAACTTHKRPLCFVLPSSPACCPQDSVASGPPSQQQQLQLQRSGGSSAPPTCASNPPSGGSQQGGASRSGGPAFGRRAGSHPSTSGSREDFGAWAGQQGSTRFSELLESSAGTPVRLSDPSRAGASGGSDRLSHEALRASIDSVRPSFESCRELEALSDWEIKPEGALRSLLPSCFCHPVSAIPASSVRQAGRLCLQLAHVSSTQLLAR